MQSRDCANSQIAWNIYINIISEAHSYLHTMSVQGGGATNRVQREISILWLPMGLFGKSICYLVLDCTFGK